MTKNLHSDYLTRILTASVYDVAIETPLEPARSLSQRLRYSTADVAALEQA